MGQPTTGPGAALESAFGAFNDLSRDLVSSYQELEERVADLNRELAAARSERWAELLDKERLARRFELLVDALPGGVVVLDGDGCVRECNPAATDLLGGDVRGRRWRDVVAERFDPRPDDGHEISLRGGARVNISTRSLGPEPGQILLLKDVTETRKLQEHVARLERLSATGRTVAALAHQIRTPLAAALLHASRLAGDTRDKVVARLRQLENLVDDMLAFSRRGYFEVERLALGDLLVAFARGQRGLPFGREISLEIAAEPRALELQGNREALMSALQNLVDNARQAGGPRTRITLTAAASAGSIELRLADDGPGVPDHLREAIFDPFFTTRDEGTGLGLALVRAIVHAHGGRIGVEPGAISGACFVVSLPRAGAGGGDGSADAGASVPVPRCPERFESGEEEAAI